MSGLRAFDSLIDVVLAIDSELRVRYGNGPAAELLDSSVRRLQSGKPLDQWIDLRGADVTPVDLVSSEEPTPYREIEYKTPSGKSGWAQISSQKAPGAMLPSESPPLWLLFIRDVSLEKTLHGKYRAELDQKEAVIEDLKSARAKLEDYSKNLEKMVADRTLELSEANRLLKAVFDSLGQGIVVFDSAGALLPMHSKVATTIFEREPVGLTAAELLRLDPSEKAGFDKWLQALFSGLIPFEDLAALGPSSFKGAASKSISLAYEPMLDESGEAKSVVMVATDNTSEVEARAIAEAEREFARMVARVAGNRSQFRAFASEALRLYQVLFRAFSQTGGSFSEAKRALHTLKGGAASFGLVSVAREIHSLEDAIAARETSAAAAAIKEDELSELRFRADLLRKSEASRAGFESFLSENAELFGGFRAGEGRTVETPARSLRIWKEAFEAADAGDVSEARALAQEIETRYLREPCSEIFKNLDGTIGDLASSLGKPKPRLEFIGAELCVDPEPFAELFASLIHGIRNAVDHGLEMPVERELAGKSPQGTISIRFAETSDEKAGYGKAKNGLKLQIEIADDGRGVDPTKIREKLRALGRGDAAKSTPDEEIIQCIFDDGFSTADREVTTISGRGAGMSAIRSAAEALGGSVRFASRLGKGSSLFIEAPMAGSVSGTKGAAGMSTGISTGVSAGVQSGAHRASPRKLRASS